MLLESRLVRVALLLVPALLLAGCGGSRSTGQPPPQPDFSISIPGSVTVTPNSNQTVSVAVTGTNGFAGSVNLAISGLPSGVVASPATFALAPATPSTTSQTITLTAAANVTASPIVFSVTGTSGSLTHTVATSTATSDFALAVAQPNLSLTAGSTTTLSVSADGFNSFTGPVTLALTGLPEGVTASPSSITLSSGVARTITLASAQSSQPTTSTIVMQGTSGSLTHNLDLTLSVAAAPPADFSLGASPSTVTLQAGGSAQSFTVSASGLNGFTGPVAVTLSGLPAGLVAMPAAFTLQPGTPQQVSLSAASTASAGTTSLGVLGTSGSLSHMASVTVAVQQPAQDFSLSLDTTSVGLTIGGAAQQVQVRANAVGTFSSPVSLTVSGLPAGVSASPSSLTLTPGTAQTISLQAGGAAVAGSTAITLQGVAGTLTHSASVTLTVAGPAPDFQLFAGPSTLNLPITGNGQLTIALIPVNGFSGAATVTVSGLPAGVSLVNPALPLVANIPQAIWFYALSAVPGQTPVTITASSGSVTHTAQVNLVVTTAASYYTPGISAGPDPSNQVASPGMLLTPGTYTLSVVAAAGTMVQFSGLVAGTSLDQNQYTFPGTSPSVATFHITVSPSAVGERGVLLANFTGSSMDSEVDLPIYVVAQPELVAYVPPLSVAQGGATDIPYETASTAPAVVQLYLGPNWPQNLWLSPYPVNPADQQLAGASGVQVVHQLFGGPSSQAGLLSLSAAANMVSGPNNLSLAFVSGSLSQSVPVAVQVAPYSDFKVSVQPSTIALEAGGTQSLTLTASGLGSFSGPIQVNLDDLPSGVQASPQSLNLTTTAAGTVTLTAGSGYSTGGTFNLDSTSGSINHLTQIAVAPGSATTTLVTTGTTFSGIGVAQIFNSGAYNSVESIQPYPGATYPNAMQAMIGYEPYPKVGSYSSNCNGNTSNSSCTPATVAIYPYGPIESPVLDQPGTITLNANVPGVSSAVLYYDQILPDFSLSFSPASLTIPAGGGATVTITYSAISPTFTSYCDSAWVANLGNQKIFNATLTAPPNGPVVSSTALDLCGPGPITATVSVPANTPPGDYEVTVNGLLSEGYEPNYSPAAQFNLNAYVEAAHTFGFGVTVTAAPPPGLTHSHASRPGVEPLRALP